jgi:hypothetical protein
MNFRSVVPVRWILVVVLSGLVVLGLRAANVTPSVRDTLVYKDGDRVQGHVVSQTPELIVFKADRFGELRVPAADAVVIKADKTAAAAPGAVVAETKPTPMTPPAPTPAPVPKPTPAATAQKGAPKPAEIAEEEEKLSIWDRFSPSVLTAKVRNVFGPWHGKLLFSTEVVSDIAHRSNRSWETHLQRKWKADEVQLNARYDFNEVNQVTQTDLAKFWGQWRHEFSTKLFTQYRPTTEWNRASNFRGVPNDYVLLQQELGVGFHLLTRPTRKVRMGVSQNRFDTWNTAPGAEHTSRRAMSAFEEIDLSLPWRITISQRAVWYPVPNQIDGWENRIELNKKLTETLSAAIRHEKRQHNPDGTATDYERLKLLLGLDF